MAYNLKSWDDGWPGTQRVVVFMLSEGRGHLTAWPHLRRGQIPNRLKTVCVEQYFTAIKIYAYVLKDIMLEQGSWGTTMHRLTVCQHWSQMPPHTSEASKQPPDFHQYSLVLWGKWEWAKFMLADSRPRKEITKFQFHCSDFFVIP